MPEKKTEELKAEEILGEKDLQGPSSFCFLPDGSLLVVDECAHQLKIFSERGELIKTIGQKGKGRGQLWYPTDAAVVEDRICVTDRFNHKVKSFDMSGNLLWETGGYGNGEGDLIDPYGITVCGGSRIAVADQGNARIKIFDTDGRLQFLFGKKGIGREYYESAVFKSNWAFQLWTKEVSRFKSIESRFFEDGYALGNLDMPRGLWYREPFFYVCDYSGRIQVFSSSGELTRTYYNQGRAKSFTYALWMQAEEESLFFSRELDRAVYSIDNNGKTDIFFKCQEHYVECFRIRPPHLYFLSPWERKLFRVRISS